MTNREEFKLPIAALVAGISLVIVLMVIVGAYHLERQASEERRQDRAFLTTRTDVMLCERMNRERDILADLIRRVIVANADPESRKQAAEFFAQDLDRLKPENCSELPSADGDDP